MLLSFLDGVLIHQKVAILATQERTSVLSYVFFPSLTCRSVTYIKQIAGVKIWACKNLCHLNVHTPFQQGVVTGH